MSDWFDEGGSGSPVDVVALFDGPAGTFVFEIVETGALVSIGTTRDGGAVGITVTVDGRWRREYFRDADSAQLWLGTAAAALGGNGHSALVSASSVTRKPRRRPQKPS